MIEGKGFGGKKVARVNVSLSNQYETKLKRLATACNMPPTTLACLLIELSLDSAALVGSLQDNYNVHKAYRVLPVESSEGIELVLHEKG